MSTAEKGARIRAGTLACAGSVKQEEGKNCTQQPKRNIGFDGRMFLTSAEWETYCRRSPVRYVRKSRADKCQICGECAAVDNPLQHSHVIGFDVGLIELGLTPDTLDSAENIVTAHRLVCNRSAEVGLEESMRLLRRRGVTQLPGYLPVQTQALWNQPA